MMLWKSVRANEETLIFPNIHRCDYSIDSTMPYEIGILKPFLQKLLSAVSESDPSKGEAERILKRLEGVPALSADLISEKSLYKEFI